MTSVYIYKNALPLNSVRHLAGLGRGKFHFEDHFLKMMKELGSIET